MDKKLTAKQKRFVEEYLVDEDDENTEIDVEDLEEVLTDEDIVMKLKV